MKPWAAAAGIVLLGAAALLSGCTGIVAGSTAAGLMVAHDRRTTGTVIEDQAIEFKAAKAIFDDTELRGQAHLNVTSFNTIALITGEAPSEALKRRAGEIVNGVDKVRRVYNEVAIAAPSALVSRSSDSLITAKSKVALFSVKGIDGFDPTRVKVITENGTVYLLGLLSRHEAQLVTEEVRNVPGVQKVIKLFEYLD